MALSQGLSPNTLSSDLLDGLSASGLVLEALVVIILATVVIVATVIIVATVVVILALIVMIVVMVVLVDLALRVVLVTRVRLRGALVARIAVVVIAGIRARIGAGGRGPWGISAVVWPIWGAEAARWVGRVQGARRPTSVNLVRLDGASGDGDPEECHCGNELSGEAHD